VTDATEEGAGNSGNHGRRLSIFILRISKLEATCIHRMSPFLTTEESDQQAGTEFRAVPTFVGIE
ncbi:MAG: hypothetical protein WD052_13460, partial [Bacteroidales bacterium]